jgi:hypothetical protein
MTRSSTTTLTFLLAATLTAATAVAQPSVQNLRVAADASGGLLPPAEAPPGEKRYHLDTGTDRLFIAFDCAAPAEGLTQIRVMQPPGTILFQEDASCAAGGQQVVVYDRAGQPFSDNEYVVNVYVGDKELYLADSVQFAVGAASIPASQGDATLVPAPESQATLIAAPGEPAPTASPAPGGPSTALLAIAGLGILALVAIVAWAGRAATRT